MTQQHSAGAGGHLVSFNARPERSLIASEGGSHHHVYFSIKVGSLPLERESTRPPLRLALVIDRSGSMAGEKVETAKRAALAVLHSLSRVDQAAVVVFNDQVDVVAEAALVTPEAAAHIREVLAFVDARRTTALHQGWLTGCEQIASTSPGDHALARVFLLTDGLANQGVRDPEQIASQAAGVLDNASISTSTFGIGADYNEGLLSRMAVAGGGQFHHLRTPDEIAETFVGEVGELLTVAAARVRLEIETPDGVAAEMVSQYVLGGGNGAWTCPIGDLLAGESRQVVVRFGFPTGTVGAPANLRARAVWQQEGLEGHSTWQDLAFTYANEGDRGAEHAGRESLHWTGLHHGYRALSRATARNQQGDLEGARSVLRRTAARIRQYEAGDPELVAMRARLEREAGELSEVVVPAMSAKERMMASIRESRGQRDLRGRPGPRP